MTAKSHFFSEEEAVAFHFVFRVEKACVGIGKWVADRSELVSRVIGSLVQEILAALH
jgi:hypothetical protein